MYKKETKIIICSKDSDYDQLIKHLDGHGISIKRVGLNENVGKQIIESKQTKQKKASIKTDETMKIMEYLQKQTASQKSKRPKKIMTLENYLYAHFSQKIQMDKIKEAIEFMKVNKNLTITNNKINYNDI
jgi:hypothetical protein